MVRRWRSDANGSAFRCRYVDRVRSRGRRPTWVTTWLTGGSWRAIGDGVVVEPGDGMAVLRAFGHLDAAVWWEEHLASRPMTSGLVFRRAEGEFLPSRLVFMLHPELTDFESGFD